MLLRPNVVFAAAGTALPRNKLGACGIQVYSPGAMFWSKKSLILRNAPYTIENPHLGQIQARLNFGDHASMHKGERGFERGLPVVAARLQDALSGYRAANRMEPEKYPSRQRGFHTMDDLRSMLERKRVTAAGAPPAYAGRF